jgi:hypothetical protein
LTYRLKPSGKENMRNNLHKGTKMGVRQQPLIARGVLYAAIRPLLAICFVAGLAVSTLRADSITVTPSSSNMLTVAEGNTLIENFDVTISDTSGLVYFFQFVGSNLSASGPDFKDLPNSETTTTTCPVVISAPSTACSMTMILTTDLPVGETDADRGNFLLEAAIFYLTFDTNGRHPLLGSSGFIPGYSVVDPVPVPEPSGLLQLSVGLFSLMGVRMAFLRRTQPG